jgi:enterochelin esterase-like enzyme
VGLLDSTTIWLAAILTVGLGCAAVVVADRNRGRRSTRLLLVSGLVVSAQLTAVLFVGLAVNAHFGLYMSWSELLGRSGVSTGPAAVASTSVDRADHTLLFADYLRHRGTVLPLTVPAPDTGLPPEPGYVYLPPQYGDPALASVRFPVIELLDGVPGHPATWLGPLHLQRTLDTAIASLRTQPFIAVLPTMTPLTGRDTECVNVWRGPAVDTYLTTDVRAAVLGAVRAQPDPHAWGLMGYSTGGYCALNLAMRHPQLFGAAVSLSGYDHPYLDHTTGALFGRSAALLDQNTPLWEEEHWSGPRLPLLLVVSLPDRTAYHAAVRMLDAKHRATLQIAVDFLRHGGHNFALWGTLEPTAFNWFSQRLSPPLASTDLRGIIAPPPLPVAHLAHRPPHRGASGAHAI